MGWKMMQQRIWKLIILCVILSTLDVPGSTGFVPPSQEEAAVGDGPTTEPQSDGFLQPPLISPILKSPPVGQTVKGPAPVLAPSESSTLPLQDSAPPPSSISPHVSPPPSPILEVPPHASLPLPPMLGLPPALAPPPPILEVPPHASAPFTRIQIVPPQASTPPPPNLPNASTPPPPIPVVPPDSTPPPPPMDAVPPHAIIPPPPIVEVPPHAFALVPPIAVVPPHAPTPPPPNPALPPHAYTPPPPIPVRSPLAFTPHPPIQATLPHASTPPPPIQATLPHASTPPPPIQTMPPHASTPLPPILATPPVAYIPPPPILEVPPHASAPFTPIQIVPPQASTSPPPNLPNASTLPPPIPVVPLDSTPPPPPMDAVPPHAIIPPAPFVEVPPHAFALAPPIAVVPPHAPTPPPPNPALPPHAYTPPPPIPVRSPLAFAPPPPIQAMLPHASTPPPPIQTMPPHASTPLPPILATPPVAYIPPPPIVVVPPHAFAPPSVDVPPHAQPSPNLAVPSHPYVPPSPILVEAPFAYASPPPILAVPPHASSPPSHTLPTHDPPVPPNVLAPPHNSVPAQPLPAMPTPTSLPIPISVLPPINNSVPSHSALPQTPSAPPTLSPRPSSRHSAPPLPLGPLNPNVSSPRHTSRPPTSPVAPLAPQPSLGLPTRALSPTSSVVSPTPNALAPPHHALPQAPIVPPRTLSPPPSRSPPLVLAPSVPAMPLYPNASAPPRTSPPSPPLLPPLSPAQPPSKLSRKASSPPLIVVSEPPKISSLSNKPQPLHPTMSPLGSGQPPSRLPVQISAPTPSTLPLPQNVSTPPHNFPPVLPTVPPLDSAQAPSRLPLQTSPPPPAAMPIPPNVSAPPMHVMGQHASAPKQVAGSLSPQASPAPRSTKPSDASSPPASVVDQGNVPSISPLTSRPQGQYRHHKASPSVAAAPGFSPNRAPSAINSTIHTNSDPSPAGAALPSPETSPSESFPAASPSTSYVKHQFPRNNISSPAPETSGGSESPPYAPQSLNRHTHPSIRHAGSSEANIPSPSPLATGNINLAPPLPLIAPSGHSEIPSVSPEISPSRASTNNQTRPLAIPIIALPPPPPNEDCAYLTCTEPLTNTPPGSPCGCVYPMQVRLRLSVDLYTFFPQVLELAREIAAGVFMKQSQVRIMGANAAIQQPEKTDVLIYLVPLGEKFDNVTAFLTFQRFWHKQVSIDKSVFGDYEVLYVHYSGLPPSPPVASSDMAVTNSKPGSGQDASGVHPLAADVSRQRRKHGLSGVLIAVIVFSAAAAMLLCLSIVWVLLVRRRKNVPRKPNSHAQISSLTRHSGTAVHSGGSGPSSASLSLGSSIAAYTGSAKTFSIGEIEKATDKFNPSKVLGEGGFGLVYSGILEDGTKIAVKVLKRDDQQGGREFFAEVEMLSRLHHRNLVKLIGICVEERTRCLVYELVPNGSVESHLHGIDRETSPLEWATRMKIALGAARGLAYLHEDSSPRVIHRDFKASNILLENDFTPKVSDFGLARTGMEEESRHISTRVMGTFGYVAPEYAMTGHLLVKSDVYSYGVVLLELLTGRKPVDMSQPTGQENLVAWTRPLLTSREGLESIIDPSLGQNVSYNSIAKVAAIASMCVQPEVSHRPFMGEVVQALKLVCNECEDTKDDESIRTSCSHENFSSDFDPRMSPVSVEMLNPTQSELTIHNYVSGHDLEKGVSVSDIFGASEMLGRQASGSSRRHSASGPMRVGRRDRWFWHKSWRSGGSVSENDIMHKFWSGSH